MNTKQALFVYIMIIGALCVGVEAAAPKTSVPARRPVSATNTTTKAKAARYNNVKNAASRFDKDFQSVPNTPGEIKFILARMCAQGATQEDLQRFRGHLVGGKFAYLASSTMVARATSPKERAMCRCHYGIDLSCGMKNSDDKLPQFVSGELESALADAINNRIDIDEPVLVASLVNSLGAYYSWNDDDLDKSWKLYSKHETIIQTEGCIRNAYLGNIANRLRYGKNSLRMNSETIVHMRTYLDKMLLENNLSYGEKERCEQLIKALSNVKKGGVTNKNLR